MKKLFVALVTLCLIATGAQSFWQSRDSNYDISIAASGFTGPGDTVSGAAFWGGTVAYNAAYNGSALDVCDAVDAHCVTATVQGNTLTIPLLNGVTCASLGTNCTVKTIYNQSGGVAGNATQATIANRATLTFSGLGTCATLTFDGTAQFEQTASNLSQTQPVTFSVIAKRTGNTAVVNTPMGLGSPKVSFSDTSGNMYMYAGGGAQNFAATENIFHAAQAMFNAASSILYIDGTSNAANTTGTATAASDVLAIGANGLGAGAEKLTGQILGLGYWSGDKSGSNAAMNTTEHALCGGW